MKKLITSAIMALTAVTFGFTSQAAAVMGADVPQSQYTAYELEGKYALNYYSLIIMNGTEAGEQYNFVYLDIEAIDDSTVLLKHFFHNDCDDITATFDNSTMTISVPNNYFLGTWTYQPGEINEKKIDAYLRLFDTTALTPNTLAENDIVFNVDPQKRVITFSTDNNNDGNCALMVTDQDDTAYVENFKTIDYYFINFLSEYDFKNSPKKAPHFVNYVKEENILYAYNFNCEGWYNMPVEFVVNSDLTVLSATDQYYAYDATDPDWNFWITEPGKSNPYYLEGTISNAENGYTVKFPTWTYMNRYGQYFGTMDNYHGELLGEVFGPTCEKPVITPSIDEYAENPTDKATISCVEGAEIYYTVDGEIPTENSLYYSNPVNIGPNSILKAIAVVDGKLPSFVTVVDYSKSGVEKFSTEPLMPQVINGKIIAPAGSKLYNIEGKAMDLDSQLERGVYIVKTDSKSYKVFVK